jgi:hypothetical protein
MAVSVIGLFRHFSSWFCAEYKALKCLFQYYFSTSNKILNCTVALRKHNEARQCKKTWIFILT